MLKKEKAVVRVAVTKNNMPMYKLQCTKCGKAEDYFTGKVLSSGELEQKACRFCSKKALTKIPQPINSAKFAKGSSRQSLKTRTGVGEVQFAQGADKLIEDANK